MGLELTKPFEAYVSIEAFPGTGEVRRFILHLRYELESTWDSGELTWPWEYAGAQQRGDAQDATDSYQRRLVEELQKFQAHVEYELELREQRLYERPGSEALVVAPLAPSGGAG